MVLIMQFLLGTVWKAEEHQFTHIHTQIGKNQNVQILILTLTLQKDPGIGGGIESRRQQHEIFGDFRTRGIELHSETPACL